MWNAPAERVPRPAAVTCTDLRRGRTLDGCSLSVPPGSRLLVVSEPEETASTLLRVLAGLSRADGGVVQMAGSTDASGAGWGRRVTYLGPHPGLYPWMTPIEALRLAGGLVDLPADETARRMERVLSWTGIPPAVAVAPIDRGGAPLHQRTGFAAALIGDPEVLLLDEPLRALDDGERSRMLDLPDRRRTVLLASRHPASEAGHVEQVAFLRGGRVRLIAPIAALARSELPLTHVGIAALAEMRAALSASSGVGPA